MKKMLFILMLSSFLVSYGFAGIEVMTLLTEEEGAIEEAPSGLYEVGRTLNNGPDVKLIAPEPNNEYTAPLKITILFIPAGGKDVDLSKLKVECLKLFTIDLTERVLPYTTKEGIKIENAKLPKGNHKIRITIGDVEGGITQEVFVAKVI